MVATVWPFFTLIALFDVEVGDAAHGSGAKIDIGLGLIWPVPLTTEDKSWRSILAVRTLV